MKVILVVYINCGGIPPNAISEHLKTVYDSLSIEEQDDIKTYVVPTDGETRIECIYPVFIASEKKVEETKLKLDEINNLFLKNLSKFINE